MEELIIILIILLLVSCCTLQIIIEIVICISICKAIFYKQDEPKYCCICFENEICKKLICGHIIGKKCIEEWTEISNSCPLCRKKLIDE